jgi:uncharacterized protein YaaN involved in tellurite resistance
MDPLSASASAAGLFGLLVQIRQILKGVIADAKSAPEEAELLITEVEALSKALEKLIEFLGREDLKECRFDKTSALRVAIDAGQVCLEKLYTKLIGLRDAYSGNKLTETVARLKWPFTRADFQQTITEQQRYTRTFQFSLTVENWSVIPDSP